MDRSQSLSSLNISTNSVTYPAPVAVRWSPQEIQMLLQNRNISAAAIVRQIKLGNRNHIQNRIEEQSQMLHRAAQLLTTEITASKDIVESFGPNGLISGFEEEITEAEEIIFQKVLRRKMICDICITHMKQFRCSECLYSMCLSCKDTISPQTTWRVVCPHCRTRQKKFEQIKLPRY